MAAIYESVTHDLSLFGINDIESAIILSEKDIGVSISVSFDDGETFYKTENERFDVVNSTGKIKVRVIFNNESNGSYLIPVSSNFQMLSIGTTIYFTNNSNEREFQTNIGVNGSYTIELPRGEYTVWYIDRYGDQTIIIDSFVPDMYIHPVNNSMAKESIIQMTFRDIEWSKYCIFDSFENLNKMKSGNAELNYEMNLIDPTTNKLCKWWAIGIS